MAATTARISVGTSAALLAADADSGAALIRNRGTGAVYLGDASVTSATGFQVDPGETIPMDLYPGDALYAISASGSNSVHVLRVGA